MSDDVPIRRKGGEVYVRGSAAGRPLINGWRPRVDQRLCLDYLAGPSWRATAQWRRLRILNGITLDESGCVVDLDTPYPGGNLFSLASGGAIYLRDPHHKVSDAQLNGGTFGELTPEDWALICPYLQENERLFGIRIADLLTVNGEQRAPAEVYRKVEVKEASSVLVETENR